MEMRKGAVSAAQPLTCYMLLATYRLTRLPGMNCICAHYIKIVQKIVYEVEKKSLRVLLAKCTGNDCTSIALPTSAYTSFSLTCK